MFEVVGPLVWLGLAVYFVQQCRHERRLIRNALMFFAATTMWWQEWFGDWAVYIIYNPHFALIPWGSTLWTTPNKPWAVIPAYGWYYTLSFLAFFWAVDRVRERRPDLNRWVACVVVGVPVFYVMDLLIEGGASVLGMWSYDSFVGPALQTTGGNFPLIFFSAWCTLMGTLLSNVDPDGYTVIDWLARVPRWRGLAGASGTQARHDAPAVGQVATLEGVGQQYLSPVTAQVIRMISWIGAFNLSYWVLFIFPMILIRIVVGEPSALIP